MAEDDESKILASIKAALGIQPDYEPFDIEIKMHINSVLATLNQLGVGPESGFVITDQTEWSELLVGDKLQDVKSYIYMRVKMLFDPSSMPQQVLMAYEKMIDEAAWRITVATDPMIPQLVPDIDEDDSPLIIDGGEI